MQNFIDLGGGLLRPANKVYGHTAAPAKVEVAQRYSRFDHLDDVYAYYDSFYDNSTEPDYDDHSSQYNDDFNLAARDSDDYYDNYSGNYDDESEEIDVMELRVEELMLNGYFRESVEKIRVPHWYKKESNFGSRARQGTMSWKWRNPGDARQRNQHRGFGRERKTLDSSYFLPVDDRGDVLAAILADFAAQEAAMIEHEDVFEY
jgi:hypothetical protein